jgi:nitrogen regulatory protein PII 1
MWSFILKERKTGISPVFDNDPKTQQHHGEQKMMKMVRAIVRPEKENDVVLALEAKGFPALTKTHVFGRGKQKGITVGPIHYDELPKVMLMIVTEEESVPVIVDVIQKAAFVGYEGDGKIFVSPVTESYTIRTGAKAE